MHHWRIIFSHRKIWTDTCLRSVRFPNWSLRTPLPFLLLLVFLLLLFRLIECALNGNVFVQIPPEERTTRLRRSSDIKARYVYTKGFFTFSTSAHYQTRWHIFPLLSRTALAIAKKMCPIKHRAPPLIYPSFLFVCNSSSFRRNLIHRIDNFFDNSWETAIKISRW